MAKSVNSVHLLGRLGADPDVRYAASGMAVCSLSIATTEREKGQDGEWGERTEWHRAKCFGKTAEAVANYLKKGQMCHVSGSLRTNQWEDANQIKRYTTEIIINDIVFIGGKQDAVAGQEGDRNAAAGSSGYKNEPQGNAEQDIPF